MNNKKNKLIPDLRFPEFMNEGEWEEKTVGDIYDFKVTNSFSRENLNYEKGLVKNIHYGDIHTKFNTLFDITKEKVPYINLGVPIEKIKEENFCAEGDMIFADASEDLNDIGKSIEVVNLDNQILLSGLHTLLARQKTPKLIIGFGGHLFKAYGVRNQIQREAQGAKVLGISVGRISNVNISFPKNPKEQQKVASCLSSLDALIAAQSQKLEALKEHKKGLMQNLFPREGETVPKYRFPEFLEDDDWIEKEFSRYVKLYRGSSPRPIQDYFTRDNSGVNWIKIGDTKNAVNYVISNVEEKITRKGAEKSRKVDVGELILANSMSFGKTYELAIEGCIYDGWFVLREYESEFYKPFLLQLLNSNYMQKQYMRLSAGGIVQNISSEIVYKTMILHTSPAEQKKIADCLSSLDNLIISEVAKLKELKLSKKGLMQGLFPKTIN